MMHDAGERRVTKGSEVYHCDHGHGVVAWVGCGGCGIKFGDSEVKHLAMTSRGGTWNLADAHGFHNVGRGLAAAWGERARVVSWDPEGRCYAIRSSCCPAWTKAMAADFDAGHRSWLSQEAQAEFNEEMVRAPQAKAVQLVAAGDVKAGRLCGVTTMIPTAPPNARTHPGPPTFQTECEGKVWTWVRDRPVTGFYVYFRLGGHETACAPDVTACALVAGRLHSRLQEGKPKLEVKAPLRANLCVDGRRVAEVKPGQAVGLLNDEDYAQREHGDRHNKDLADTAYHLFSQPKPHPIHKEPWPDPDDVFLEDAMGPLHWWRTEC